MNVHFIQFHAFAPRKWILFHMVHPTVLLLQVRLWDPRDGSKVAKLRGHSDNVRALALSHDGTKALSGSSDGTVKLWDVGLQRCIQVWIVKGGRGSQKE